MTDIDSALRTMLRERAQDITSVPAHLAQLDARYAPDIDRRHPHPRRTAWLVAATVAAVLAVAGVAFAIGHDRGHHTTPPATHSPSPSPTVTASHVERRVPLSWFGMASLPGYALHMRDAQPGFQLLAVRRTSDQAAPIGCNGCESASDYIYVFDKGSFDAQARHVISWQRVSVGANSAYLGTTTWVGTTYQVPSVAWQFRPGQWVLVQGVTPQGSTQQALLAVASAVRPTVSVPILLPATFDYLPAMPIVHIMDDRSEGYAFAITLGDGPHTFAFDIWSGRNWTYYDPTGMTPQTIGGLPGFYGPQQGAGVLFHDGGMAFSFGDNSGSRLTATDDAETQRVIAGLHWVNGDGRAPLVPAERAIP